MTANPLCEVSENANPYVSSINGVDVGPTSSISIRLVDFSEVSDWYLEVVGTDELSTSPGLSDVNNITHQVTSPTTVVTFIYPSSTGRAILFRSTVQGVGGSFESRFAIYSPTVIGTRVGALNERREGDTQYGWIVKLNPIIREGAAAIYYADSLAVPPLGASTVQDAIDSLKSTGATFTAGGDLSGNNVSQTVIGLQGTSVSNTPPTNGDMLSVVAGVWTPVTPSGFTASGDLSGDNTTQTVIKIQGVAVEAGIPGDGQQLQYDSKNGQWTPSSQSFFHDLIADNEYEQRVIRLQSQPLDQQQVGYHGQIPLVEAKGNSISLGDAFGSNGVVYCVREQSSYWDIISSSDTDIPVVFNVPPKGVARPDSGWFVTSGQTIYQYVNGHFYQQFSPAGVVGNLQYMYYDGVTESVWTYEDSSPIIWGYLSDYSPLQVFTGVNVTDLFTYNGYVYATSTSGDVIVYFAGTGILIESMNLGAGSVVSGGGYSTYIYVAKGTTLYRLDALTLAVSATLSLTYAPVCIRVQTGGGFQRVLALSDDHVELVGNITGAMAITHTYTLPNIDGPKPTRMGTNGTTEVLIPLPGRDRIYQLTINTANPPGTVLRAGGLVKWTYEGTFCPNHELALYGSTYTVPDNVYLVNVTDLSGTSLGAAVIELPVITSSVLGRRILVKDTSGTNETGTNTVTLSALGGEFFDGGTSSTYILRGQNASLEVVAVDDWNGVAHLYKWVVTSKGPDVLANQLGTWSKDADDTLASDVTTELVVCVVPALSKVLRISFIPTSTITANETNYAVFTFNRRNEDGTGQILMGSFDTASINSPAWEPRTITDLTNTTLTQFSYVTLEITKVGAGVVVPKGIFYVHYQVTC